MRDQHLTAIDNKIARIRTYKTIGIMIAVTLLIVSLILIFSTLNTVLMMQTDTLNKLNDFSMEVDEVRESIDTMQENRYTGQIESLGTFEITHYCSCEKCCGKSDGICKNGEEAIPDYTIATDPNIIPTGTIVMIDEKEYKAMDTGEAIKGNKVDIYVDNHQEAVSRGKFKREVRVIAKCD